MEHALIFKVCLSYLYGPLILLKCDNCLENKIVILFNGDFFSQSFFQLIFHIFKINFTFLQEEGPGVVQSGDYSSIAFF